MVTRVGKFVGGLGQDVTNVANVHATENRIAFGAAMNPTANVHVTGNAHITTTFSTGGNIIGGGTYTGGGTMTPGGNIVIPNDGDVGSVGATDAIQISSGGIVTFKDDILIKDGGTIGVASAATAITIASTGIVTFVDDIVVKDDGTIGSASAPTAMTIDSSGIVAFVDDIKIKDGGTIGTATDIDAITIAAAGAVTFSQRDVHSSGITIADGGEIGSASDTDAIAISAAGVVSFSAVTEASAIGTAALITAGGLSVAKDMWIGDDIVMDSDGAIIKMGDSQEISITHVADTGILLEDSGGSPTLQFHDAGESISSDGSKLILTSNSIAFNMPTADGDDGQVLKTDGSRTLSFTSVTTSLNPATVLASSLDCGALSGATSDTKDAFGQAVDDALAELDCLLYAENALGTVDQGALS